MGLGIPERLAEGAARGRPAARMTCRATGWEGIRTATVGNPAVTSPGTQGAWGKMMVSGPGQQASASRRAFSGMAVTRGAQSSSAAICTIRGLSIGRPLAAKIPATAPPFKASAASP